MNRFAPLFKITADPESELQLFDPLKFYVERRKPRVWRAVPLNIAQLLSLILVGQRQKWYAQEKVHKIIKCVFLFLNRVGHLLKKIPCQEHLQALVWWLGFTQGVSLHMPEVWQLLTIMTFLLIPKFSWNMKPLPASSPVVTTVEPRWNHSWTSEPPQHIHSKTSDYNRTNYRAAWIKQWKINLIWPED